jgi:hypothetical protein
MRQPTPTERRLLIVLVSAVFIALNLAGIKLLLNATNRQKIDLATARTQIKEAQVWLEEAEDLGPASRSLPSAPAMEEKSAGSELIRSVRAAADSAGLSILEESLPGPPEDVTEPVAILRLKLSGPFSGAVRFLYEIQPAGGWRAIESLIVKAEASPQNVLAEMEIRQYYSESGPKPADAANP